MLWTTNLVLLFPSFQMRVFVSILLSQFLQFWMVCEEIIIFSFLIYSSLGLDGLLPLDETFRSYHLGSGEYILPGEKSELNLWWIDRLTVTNFNFFTKSFQLFPWWQQRRFTHSYPILFFLNSLWSCNLLQPMRYEQEIWVCHLGTETLIATL